jgi:hypothetical protein
MAETTYKIVRLHFEEGVPNRIVDRGLTLEEAQAHCRNKETSSRTCTSPVAKAYTAKFGAWFDGYEEEKK